MRPVLPVREHRRQRAAKHDAERHPDQHAEDEYKSIFHLPSFSRNCFLVAFKIDLIIQLARRLKGLFRVVHHTIFAEI